MRKLTLLSTAAVLALGLAAPASARPYDTNVDASVKSRAYSDEYYYDSGRHPSHNASARAQAVANENARFNRDGYWDDREHWNEDDRRDWRNRADRNWDGSDGKWTTTARGNGNARVDRYYWEEDLKEHNQVAGTTTMAAGNRGSADYFRNDPRNNWSNDADRNEKWRDQAYYQRRWRDRDDWRRDRW